MNDRPHVGKKFTLLFGSCSSPLMYLTALLGKTARGWTVYSNLVPRINVDVKGFQRSLESVLEALLLSTNFLVGRNIL